MEIIIKYFIILFENELDEKILNQEEIYDQLPQSLIMSLYQDPEVRYIKFLLGSYVEGQPTYRVLVYDKQTRQHTFEPFK